MRDGGVVCCHRLAFFRLPDPADDGGGATRREIRQDLGPVGQVEPVHDPAGSVAEQDHVGQVGDRAASGDRLGRCPRILLRHPETAWLVTVGAQRFDELIAGLLILGATLRGRLQRGPIRPAEGHLPRIGDDER